MVPPACHLELTTGLSLDRVEGHISKHSILSGVTEVGLCPLGLSHVEFTAGDASPEFGFSGV